VFNIQGKGFKASRGDQATESFREGRRLKKMSALDWIFSKFRLLLEQFDAGNKQLHDFVACPIDKSDGIQLPTHTGRPRQSRLPEALYAPGVPAVPVSLCI
jgi:hypothetical protein